MVIQVIDKGHTSPALVGLLGPRVERQLKD